MATSGLVTGGAITAAPVLWLLNAPLAWLTWIYALGLSATVPWVLWNSPAEHGPWWDLVDLGCASIAVIQWWRVARANRDEVRLAAGCITAGIAFWWASELAWALCDLMGSDAAQFPSPASFGFVAFLPLFGLGLVLYIQRAVRRWFTTPLLCDFGVVTAALIVVVGFPMNELLGGSDLPLDTRIIAVGFPVLGLVLMAFNLYCLVAFGWGARRWILVLLLLGGGLIIGADFVYAMGVAAPAFAPGAGIDPLWSIGFGLISLASFEHNRAQETGNAPPIEATEQRLRRLRHLLPAAAMVAIMSTVIADAGHFSTAKGLAILLPAAILLAVSMASAALWSRRHIADLQGQADAATTAWRKAEARFGTLLEFSPDPTLAIDRRGRIQAAGKGLESAFGLSRAAALRQPIGILSPDFDTVLPRAALEQLADGESPGPSGGDAERLRLDQGIRFEVMACRRDGSRFPAEGVVFRLEDDGHQLGMVLRDVTERRNVERELRAAKEAAEIADRSKSEFLANMSHELRTPLNAIIGFADIIEAQSFGPGDPRYAHYAHDIGASGRHLLGVLKDILDFARIETRNATLHEGECAVGDLLEACLRILQLRADQAEVAVAVELSDGLPRLYVDGVKLKQVLINLLSNAIKFAPRGGDVRVTARVFPDDTFGIIIADTGIGMRPEDIPLAMAPFGQIAGAFSRGHDGLGLGLPLARQLVELHGGRLEIASQLGSGTVVSVLLPRDRVVVVAPVRQAAVI